MTVPLPLSAFPRAPYGVVYADPPWRYENWSKKGEWKNASRHYPCMTLAELKAFAADINLDFICAPDCALVMWATFPMLPECLELIRAWGFTYKTGGSWGKMARNGNPAFGPGYILRSASELYLVATRGAPKVRSRSVRNLLLAQRREHSRKPEQMYVDVERLFAGPYLELFARSTRAGWDCIGNEVGKFGRTG